MTKAYYDMRKKATDFVVAQLRYLKSNPEQCIDINDIVIHFQASYGFGKKSVINILQPYIEKGEVTYEHGTISCPRKKE